MSFNLKGLSTRIDPFLGQRNGRRSSVAAANEKNVKQFRISTTAAAKKKKKKRKKWNHFHAS